MPQRELTGRTVFIWLVAFFGIVSGANAVLIHAATSTFGGVEVDSSYKAGLAFQREIAAAREQDTLHWSVSARFERRSGGAAELSLSVRDRDGAPLSSLQAVARLAHPADARRDQVVELRPVGPGLYAGATEVASAQWNLVIDLSRDGRTLFRSRSRIDLRSPP